MNARALILLILAAAPAYAAGDRVHIAHEGITTITNADTLSTNGTIARAPNDPHLIEIAGRGDLRVAVPRNIPISVDVPAGRGQVTIEHVTNNVEVSTRQANITLRDVAGNVIVATGNGNVIVDGVRGLAEVTTGNGNVTIANVTNGVRVVSINGKTEIACVAGDVSVRDTSGKVYVFSTRGDVDVFTALGQASYEGHLLQHHSYQLKTLDGAVGIAYVNGDGFNARLAADSGQIDMAGLEDKLKRLDLRAGDESARVVLDAVGGRVELNKLSSSPRTCR